MNELDEEGFGVLEGIAVDPRPTERVEYVQNRAGRIRGRRVQPRQALITSLWSEERPLYDARTATGPFLRPFIYRYYHDPIVIDDEHIVIRRAREQRLRQDVDTAYVYAQQECKARMMDDPPER